MATKTSDPTREDLVERNVQLDALEGVLTSLACGCWRTPPLLDDHTIEECFPDIKFGGGRDYDLSSSLHYKLWPNGDHDEAADGPLGPEALRAAARACMIEARVMGNLAANRTCWRRWRQRSLWQRSP